MRRESDGHDIEKFGRKIGLTAFQVSQLESARTPLPDRETLESWCKTLEIPNTEAEEIIFGAGMMPRYSSDYEGFGKGTLSTALTGVLQQSRRSTSQPAFLFRFFSALRRSKSNN